MRVIAIDPGPSQSAYCWMEERAGRLVPFEYGTLPNAAFIAWLRVSVLGVDHLASERCSNFSDAGEPVMGTQLMVGRIVEIGLSADKPVTLIYPSQKQTVLCQRQRGVTKPMMNQALRALYGDGSKTGKGTKSVPGLLYGIKEHEWSALAVGRTWEVLFPLGDLDVQTIENMVDDEGNKTERWRKERDNKRRPKDKVEREAKPVESRPEAHATTTTVDPSKRLLYNDFVQGTEYWKSFFTYSTYCRICAQVPGECTCRDGFQPASAPTAPVPF